MRISSHFRREHHVYTVEACDRSSFRVSELCRVMKSVQIPFGYSRYLADDEFGVVLTWKTVLGGGVRGLPSKQLRGKCTV
ncbi:unnamed protein product [Linum trigynum]|uniref:Uncharacterized protein n=1 Tax=Linum trigynum TaxID=586398 RepID=A0AAV2FTF1_9ROSI